MTSAKLLSNMQKMKCRRRVIDRVLRLNPNPQPGYVLRGWHRRYDRGPVFEELTGKGRVIRQFGRGSWALIPRFAIIKRGKRQYVTREFILDWGDYLRRLTNAAA